MSEEYPVVGKGRMRRLERRALLEGWLGDNSGKITEAMSNQIEIANADERGKHTARERTQAFRTVMGALQKEDELQNQSDSIRIREAQSDFFRRRYEDDQEGELKRVPAVLFFEGEMVPIEQVEQLATQQQRQLIDQATNLSDSTGVE